MTIGSGYLWRAETLKKKQGNCKMVLAAEQQSSLPSASLSQVAPTTQRPCLPRRALVPHQGVSRCFICLGEKVRLPYAEVCHLGGEQAFRSDFPFQIKNSSLLGADKLLLLLFSLFVSQINTTHSPLVRCPEAGLKGPHLLSRYACSAWLRTLYLSVFNKQILKIFTFASRCSRLVMCLGGKFFLADGANSTILCVW